LLWTWPQLNQQSTPHGQLPVTQDGLWWDHKTEGVTYNNSNGASSVAALTTADFLRDSCAQMKLGVGARDHQECPHRVTFDYYSPSDSATLQEAIHAAYRHLHGNCYVMDNERAAELESQLSHGSLSIREFVRALVKRDFYKDRFFSVVSPHRGIELAFKHLLGRPPLHQQEISAAIATQAAHGFDALVDSLVDSAEYSEVFGADTVPHSRAWTSASGMPMINFVRMAALEQNFVTSDRNNGSASILLGNLTKGTPLPIKVSKKVNFVGVSAAWGAGKPPANYEKLWRGLALVGGAHLAGMLVNVLSQMAGIHALDRIPAMFLGL